MKRCPRCNSVFDDGLVYCTTDGTPLVAESFVLPSEAAPPDDREEATVIRSTPVRIEIPPENPPAPTEAFNFQVPPAVNVVPPVVVEEPSRTGRGCLLLGLGIVLGGLLVLGAVLLGVFWYQKTQTNTNAARNAPANNSPTPKATPTSVEASAVHSKRTDAPDDKFNGRVITINAFVRTSPNRNAKEIDILPVDDRLDIKERENDNSPWYRVTCEHGTSGWMHGNTIEFTR
ncbi:MAG: SH3 domain-containing protein [Acidobacteria bacterium]|nr:SH3 domain-containing protein [Acidobacteriota bacterium]